MTPDYDYGELTSYMLHLFFIFSLLCSYYITNMIKKMELCFLVVLPKIKIKFEYAQISVPQSIMSLLETASSTPAI